MKDIRDIQTTYSTEMALVVLVFRVYLNTAEPQALEQFIAANRVDWPLFEKMIAAHQVRPLVYKVLAAHRNGADDGLMERLRQNCLLIARTNLARCEEMLRVGRLLDTNNIAAIPYKGVIMSQLLFGDLITRETADIDFIINEADFLPTRELLLAQGYSSRYYNPDFHRQFLRTSHELMYSKAAGAGKMKIEIHWAVTARMMNVPLPNEAIFGDLTPMTISGQHIMVFSLEKQLLVMLVHHGVNDVWRTLRHLADLAVFTQKYRSQLNWAQLRNDAARYKVLHTAQAGFAMAARLLGIAPPEAFQTAEPPAPMMYDGLLRFPGLTKGKLNLPNLRQQLYLRDSLADKLALLRSYARMAIVPNARDMEAHPLPANRYFLYYFLKPLRLIKKGR